MTGPRNVTPEDERQQMVQEEAERRHEQTEWSQPAWTTARGGRFPWLGVLLVLVGIALLIQAAVPPNTVSTGTVLLIAIGIALVAGWVFGGSWFAVVPGLLLLALGAAGLLRELRVYDGPGLTALSLAAAFLVIWIIGLWRDRRSRWPLVAAALLGLIGAIQVFGQLSNIPELNVVWPIVIIVVGIILLVVARRR
jgi:hypothetical protein